jgi:hypothetical protein
MAKKQTTVNEEELEHEENLEAENEEEEFEEEEEELEEDSEAAQTLKPGSKSFPDPKSKIEVMKAVIGAIASASSDELTKWNDQALALIGHEADKIPDGAASSNKHSIDANPSNAVKESVREDLKVLFDADKTLTEEAKERLETVFEAAVTARVLIEREEMEEQMTEELSEAIEEVKGEIEEQLNSYLSYCAENWMAENEVAIESTLRAELAEEFIDGLRDLFTEHFIDIPETKTDVIEALTEKVSELEEVLNNVIDENNELKGVYVESELGDAIEEVAEGLTVSQTEKLAALCEDIEFDGDIDNFKKKVGIVKETYFSGANGKAESEPDDFEKADNELNEEATVISDPVMRKYAAKISQTVKEDLRVK